MPVAGAQVTLQSKRKWNQNYLEFCGRHQFGDKVDTVGWSREAGMPQTKLIRDAYTEESQKNQHDVDGRSRRSISPITAVHSCWFFLFCKQRYNNEKITFIQ